jgi:hypothetical protein
MKETNNEQNSVIIQIEEVLNKMSNQVGFLIRNKKLINQLDLDLLMENTRKLYDTLCSVKCNMDVDSITMEVEGEEGLEGIEGLEGEEGLEGIEGEIEKIEDEEDVFESSKVLEIESSEIEEEYEEFERDFEDDIEEALEEEEGLEGEEGLEEIEEEEGLEGEEEIEEEEAELEGSVQGEQEDSGIRAYKKVYTIESHTLGDKLESAEDTSLAARLQRKPVSDLASAIGINDKFLLLNQLFGGSMEKYNKSIRALNNFSTLLGAKTYMSELQIEFQWDCESDAYKKLDNLVERRFM